MDVIEIEVTLKITHYVIRNVIL